MNTDTRLKPGAVADQIRGMYTDGRQPTFREIDPGLWETALYVLINDGDFPSARFGAAFLLAAQPQNDAMRTLCRLIDVAPRADAETALAIDKSLEIQIAARPGATTAVLVFGRSQPLGLPFGLTHRWLGRLDASIVYLADFSGNGTFVSGIMSLGDNRDAATSELKRRVADLGATRIVCAGAGKAGYAAVLYAAELGADAAISLGGPASLAAGRVGQASHRQRGPGLAEVLASTPNPPRVLVVAGDENEEDRRQAQRLAALPSVTVALMERHAGHEIAAELVCRGQIDRTLDWLMKATPAGAPDFGALPAFPWRDIFA